VATTAARPAGPAATAAPVSAAAPAATVVRAAPTARPARRAPTSRDSPPLMDTATAARSKDPAAVVVCGAATARREASGCWRGGLPANRQRQSSRVRQRTATPRPLARRRRRPRAGEPGRHRPAVVSPSVRYSPASMTNSSSWCRCRVHWRINPRGHTSPAPKAQTPKASPFAAASAPSLAPPKPADRTVRWPHRLCRQWWSGPVNACPVRQTRPERDITPVHFGSKRPHTTRSPAGIFCGSRQNASLTNRLNRSGGSNVSRGSALTSPRTVCSPGVPARSSNPVTS
jgi:hypothetical protein